MLVEPCIYWPDARLAFHETVLDPAYLAKLPVFAENLPARQVVAQLDLRFETLILPAIGRNH